MANGKCIIASGRTTFAPRCNSQTYSKVLSDIFVMFGTTLIVASEFLASLWRVQDPNHTPTCVSKD